MKRPSPNPMQLLAALLLAFLAAACASMGRPTGGPRDVEPPRFLYSNPAMGSVNFSGNRLRAYFDENVQVKDAMTKIVVSPPQLTAPAISSNGHWVQVEFRDTMQPNTTYTVDFSDAISDLNEGNPLDGFAVDFSTGPTIDTLRISGMVVQASNLEPAQGMIVGVYSNLSDTAITTLPMERVTKTNQLGRFTIRNLKPGTYRIFAINDANRDYRWDRTEDVAFYDTLITPWAEPTTVRDTLAAADGSDSIVTRQATAFYPNDILLTWFNENYRTQYLAKNERPNRSLINIELGAPSDTFPIMRIVGAGDLDGLTSDHWALRTSTATRDTLSYWITDTLVAGMDSLTVALTYQRPDSTEQLAWTTDTLRLFMRGNNTRKAELKREAEALEKRRKALEKGDTLPEPAAPKLALALPNEAQHVNKPLTITAREPMVGLRPEAFHLNLQQDSLWIATDKPPRVEITDSLNPMELRVDFAWEPGAKYQLVIDSAAVTGVYGAPSGAVTKEIDVHKMEDYSTIKFNVKGQGSEPLVVELLSKSDAPVASAPVNDEGVALFEFLMPSTYYARAYIDRNRNGRYDTGNLRDSIQPEEVVYYPKKLTLKKNWDIEQTWDIYEQPLDLQKPLDIKKNKPKKKRGEDDFDNLDDEEDEEDDYYQGQFGPDLFNPGGNTRYDRNARQNQRNNQRGNQRGTSTRSPRNSYGR